MPPGAIDPFDSVCTGRATTRRAEPVEVGGLREDTRYTPTIRPRTTAAITTGTSGGRLQRALSSSSLMGICPASGRGSAGLLIGGVEGLDIGPPVETATLNLRCQFHD